MKIKSWTGEEVEARVGMVVKDPLGLYTGTMAHKLNNGAWEFEDGMFVGNLLGYTMIYCKFKLGDSVDIIDLETGEWNYAGEITHIDGEYVEIDGLCGCEGLEQIRHANPNLRTSPEYKP